MEAWSTKLNSLYTKARERLDDIAKSLKENNAAFSYITRATVQHPHRHRAIDCHLTLSLLSDALNDPSAIPLVYNALGDMTNVTFVRCSDQGVNLAQCIRALPHHIQFKWQSLCARAFVYVAKWQDEDNRYIYIPWPRYAWNTQSLPVVTSIIEGSLRTIRLKLLSLPGPDLMNECPDYPADR